MAAKIIVVDYAFQHPTVDQLKAAGVTDVGRYLGQADSEPKNLSLPEAQQLAQAGIGIFTIFEYAAQQALGGASQARADVALFREQRAAVKMPDDRPCYFASDFDVPDYDPSLPDTPANAKAKLGPLYDYYHTIREEIGGNAGGYGGYYLIKRLFDSGCISWGFQTIAWSGGQWDKRACLRQLAETEFGGAADVDTPERTDFGQWKPGQGNPRPQPGPTKAQALVAARTVLDYIQKH